MAYHFNIPLSVGALVTPIGFGVADKGTAFVAVAQALAALDLALFSIGFGVGLGTSNDEPKVESAFATSQLVRLGALDGFHLEVRNVNLLYKDEFRDGATNASIQIPGGQSWWILLRGGGGPTGYGYGEAGLRLRLRGNGLHDSVFLSVTIGGGAVINKDADECSGCETVRGGPMAGIGVECRP